jgi:hypothetical protein
MKISIISDLHLEMKVGRTPSTAYLDAVIKRLEKCDVRLLAGDLTNRWGQDFHKVMDALSETANLVFTVSSNHLFYSSSKSIRFINEQICKNWGNQFLDCQTKPLKLTNDISIIGDIGWYNGDSIINKSSHDNARLYNNDYKYIRLGEKGSRFGLKPVHGSNPISRRLKEPIFFKMGKASEQRLRILAEQVTTPTLIIMTHFAPRRKFARSENKNSMGLEFGGFYSHHALGNISIEQAKRGINVLHVFGHVHSKYPINEKSEGVHWV